MLVCFKISVINRHLINTAVYFYEIPTHFSIKRNFCYWFNFYYYFIFSRFNLRHFLTFLMQVLFDQYFLYYLYFPKQWPPINRVSFIPQSIFNCSMYIIECVMKEINMLFSKRKFQFYMYLYEEFFYFIDTNKYSDLFTS